MEPLGTLNGAVGATIWQLSSAIIVVTKLVVFSAKSAAVVGVQMAPVSLGRPRRGLTAMGAFVLPPVAAALSPALRPAVTDADGFATAFASDKPPRS